jgi:hypothetical protein
VKPNALLDYEADASATGFPPVMAIKTYADSAPVWRVEDQPMKGAPNFFVVVGSPRQDTRDTDIRQRMVVGTLFQFSSPYFGPRLSGPPTVFVNADTRPLALIRCEFLEEESGAATNIPDAFLRAALQEQKGERSSPGELAWNAGVQLILGNTALREAVLRSVMSSMAFEGLDIDEHTASRLLDEALSGQPLVAPGDE